MMGRIEPGVISVGGLEPCITSSPGVRHVTHIVPQSSPFSDAGPPVWQTVSDEDDRKKTETTRSILIVDDDPDLLEVTRFVLESEGFAVETAKNGEEALAILRAGAPPGLVLLDLMMPVMNGWRFLEEIAKIPSLRSIPVVVLTASEAKEVLGAVEILRKPIDIGSLIETADRYTRGWRQ
jgi:CheY-like chemotaxis protein